MQLEGLTSVLRRPALGHSAVMPAFCCFFDSVTTNRFEVYHEVFSRQFTPVERCPSTVCRTNKNNGKLSMQVNLLCRNFGKL